MKLIILSLLAFILSGPIIPSYAANTPIPADQLLSYSQALQDAIYQQGFCKSDMSDSVSYFLQNINNVNSGTIDSNYLGSVLTLEWDLPQGLNRVIYIANLAKDGKVITGLSFELDVLTSRETSVVPPVSSNVWASKIKDSLFKRRPTLRHGFSPLSMWQKS